MDDYKIAEMYLTLMTDEKSVSKNKTVSKNLKVNKTDSDSISQFTCGRSLAWTRTSACHADDPGSNPGDRTSHNPRALEIDFKV